jgi:SAM-dependent methyltransferase
MHTEQMVFIQNLRNTYPQYFNNCTVLEVGSCNVNGTIRHLFTDCEYVGLDVGPGPCVDIVCSGHQYAGPSDHYDMVISTECFEHNPYWFETFVNMIRMCRPDGLVAFTCASGIRPEHGTSRSHPSASHLTLGVGWEYYKNLSEEDFTSRMNFENHFLSGEYTFIKSYYFDNFIQRGPMDLYFWGIKK